MRCKLFKLFWKDISVKEDRTKYKKSEEEDFLDEIMRTQTMKTTLSYLRAKNIFTKSENDFKHFLSEVWFETYSRGNRWANLNSISTKTKKNDQSTTFRIKGSSGFEHVFLGEKKLNKVQGFHSWLYFSFMEEKKKVFRRGM